MVFAFRFFQVFQKKPWVVGVRFLLILNIRVYLVLETISAKMLLSNQNGDIGFKLLRHGTTALLH